MTIDPAVSIQSLHVVNAIQSPSGDDAGLTAVMPRVSCVRVDLSTATA
jgi:hypothetical protein